MKSEIQYLIDQRLLGRSLIFDLDDTIYQEIDFLKQQYFYVSQVITPSFADCAYNYLVSTFLEEGRLNLFEKFKREFSLKHDVADILSAFRDYTETRNNQLECYSWFHILLDSYSENDFLPIITNGNVCQQIEKVRRLKLAKLCSGLFPVYANSFNPKPSKDSFDFLFSRFNLVNPIYVGDSLVDKEFSDRCSIEFYDIKRITISENMACKSIR